MANTTVYPFGTEGQLPGGVAIVDDLSTGGADKALSAEQGVVLKDLADNEVTVIDTSVFPVFNGTILSNGNWYVSGTNYQSIQIPVKVGQVFRIVGNISDYTFYSFFSELSVPSSGNAPSYASGYSGRLNVAAGKTKDVTIPADTKYLYLAVKSEGNDTSAQSVSIVADKVSVATEENEELKKEIDGTPTELCNYATDDFSFNGTSAQGKVEKVGASGYLVTNIASTAGKQFLYTLPDGLVDGTTYRVQFDYKSWISANWSLYPRTEDGGSQNPTRGTSIPATGSGRVSWHFTYYNGDKYLALNSSTVGAGSAVLIENLSIVSGNLSVFDMISALNRAENIKYGGTFNPYNGRKIDLAERTYAFASYMASMPSHQSSACYGDYMFTFADKMATVKLYNLRTRTLLYTFTQTALDANHHCNQAFFGTEKYDSDDVFPLVYISVKSSDWSVSGGTMEAFRIVPTMGDSDYSSFTITKVQTITVPTMTDENALGEVNFVMDTRSGYLYTYSRNDRADAPNYNNMRLTKWRMPNLSQGDVTLSSPLASWETGTKQGAAQGATIKNHLLFFFRGYQSAGYIQLYVFDLVNRTIVAEIDLLSDGFTSEPEGAFFWGNTLYTSTNGGNLYRFIFR